MSWTEARRDLIIGQIRSGKSSRVIEDIIPEYLSTHRDAKIVIIDQVENKNYLSCRALKQNDPHVEQWKKNLLQTVTFPIPVVPFNKIQHLKKGVVRVLPSHGADIIKYSEEIIYELRTNQKIRNMLVVLEDTARFMKSKQIAGNFDSMIIDSKQRNVSIVTVFHGWAKVPPSLLDGYTNHIYLHHTKRSAKYREDELEDDLDIVLAAEQRIRNNPSEYAFEKIELIKAE